MLMVMFLEMYNHRQITRGCLVKADSDICKLVCFKYDCFQAKQSSQIKIK